ncbi:exocyst complex component EXO70B1-like [Vicia villosa]|uniref:exocyst complex component EXO70B1-like n=1 Tax=Vicia villosa TaxID=3911 RepID=UPI00273B628B|nr:exocyst complex component EXO70B1-like [Vicia villosa]
MIIQIERLFRFVSFTSSVVGLLCYALSSSFNHLFGDWNSWKIILYTLFSFIISLLILFAKIWQSSRSLRFKAHTAFLVLTITSVYSFFFDKEMNEKPDSFSLISCAAFAIMSMSLSRQSQCGFEVDLLYFFLGSLIVLLMKIKLQLFFVGAGFSYSLIIIRSSFTSFNTTAENEYLEIGGENSVVIEMTSLSLSSMMQQFMTCTEALNHESTSLIERLMEKYNTDTDTRDFVMDTLSSRKIDNLHESAKLMLASGYEKECSDAYSCWRRVFLQECLINKIFGLPMPTTNINNKMDKNEREQYSDTMFERWMTASDVAMTILFPFEQQLCNHVFSGFSSAASTCFFEVCKEATSQLLCFADVLASGSPTKWRLFKMLQIFEHLGNLITKFQSLFPESMLLNEAVAVRNRLGEASRDLFMEMHNVIFRVPTAKNTVKFHGDIHPVTSEVISYVSIACLSRQKLENILQTYSKDGNEMEASSFFVKQMEQIMEILPKKLIAKLKNCKDPALRHIFMVNNRSHIEAINQFYELETIFGNDWFQNNKAKIRQNVELYKRCSWNMVLDFLKVDKNDNITEELLKEKIHLFNTHFEEICRVQSDWFVYDNDLREEIISYVETVLLPAYGIFIGRLQDILGNQAYDYITYGMLEIQDRLSQMFMLYSSSNL